MNSAIRTSPQQQLALEQFYYAEARLLDNRQFQQWLNLLSEEILYIVPSRHNIQVDNRERGTEEMISNFHLHYSRPGCNNSLYSGQRRDTLIVEDDSYKIAHRVVVMDYATIAAPTMGLLF